MDLATPSEERPAIVQSYSRQSFATTFADNFWAGEGIEEFDRKLYRLRRLIEGSLLLDIIVLNVHG